MATETYVLTTSTAMNSSTSNWYNASGGYAVVATTPPPKVKTELDLLDERVNELRVKL